MGLFSIFFKSAKASANDKLVINQSAWGVCGFTAVLNMLYHKGLFRVEGGRILKSSVGKEEMSGFEIRDHGSITNLIYAKSILEFLDEITQEEKSMLEKNTKKFGEYEKTSIEEQVGRIVECIKSANKDNGLPQNVRSVSGVGLGMTPELIIRYMEYLGFDGCYSMQFSPQVLISKGNVEGFKFDGSRILGLSKNKDKIDHWVYVGDGKLYNKSQVVSVDDAFSFALDNAYTSILHQIECSHVRFKK